MKAADMLPFFIPKHSNPLQIGKKLPSTNFPRTIHELLNYPCTYSVICVRLILTEFKSYCYD